jgi:sarcosine oxidase subunit alpha
VNTSHRLSGARDTVAAGIDAAGIDTAGIDRGRPVSFRFDGAVYQGYLGDTLASALLASGVRVVGRSFKYHRPRGILTAGSEEPNALVELRTGARREPNTRATVAELYDGLEAHSQNRWPSLQFDVGAINSWFSPLFVAGFYYKTFMWPARFWERVYEPAIRRAAGLGRASVAADPDRYEKAHAFCDVLVIGAGPAGLAAASSAARAGARVILCDEDFLTGGRLNADRREIDAISGTQWARRTTAELEANPEVRVMRRTTVFGVYDSNTYGALERVADHLPMPPPGQPRQRLWRIVARQTVLAAGALERPIVFGGNDRPGVMMAGAVRTYLNRFRVSAGQRVALFTSTDEGWKTAIDLNAAGIEIAALIDAREEVAPALQSFAKRLDAPLLLGAQVVGTHGGHALEAISVRDRAGRTTRIRSDALAISGGFNPNVSLTTHLGGRPRWSDASSAFVPGDLPPAFRVVGSAAGDFTLAGALRSGAAAGAAAAEATGFSAFAGQELRTDEELSGHSPLWRVAHARGKAFVDFQHDVTEGDLALGVREGFTSAELLKRYTTLGMATDQGKTSALNGHAILAALTGRSIAEVGTTVARPPYTPVAIGAFAGAHRGKHFRVTRLTPSHAWAVQLGATFVEAGPWLRAQWFAAPGENDWRVTVGREVNGVRTRVGVCDVSTLGKIDVQGADAALFLDRVYCNLMSTLVVGKARYGLMLREDGIVLDDGTAARLEDDHFVVSTTTINAAKVMQHLEHARQVLWPELDVQLVSVTEQWAQFAVAGPLARRLLKRLLGEALDISDTAFPYMACKQFSWRGVAARLFRISFSGELAYELAVPARYGDSTVRAIMNCGAELGVVPYGTEALGVMRIEKGHVAGNELNGTTTAGDLGLGRMQSGKKDYIGRVLAARPGLIDPARPALVGLKPTDPDVRIHPGAHLLTLKSAATLENDQGFISSVAYSPTMLQWIALGFLRGGASRLGEQIRAFDPLRGLDVPVLVTSPTFYDPDGVRLRAAD